MKILINALIQNRKKTLTFSAASIFYTLFLLYVWTLFSETFGDILNLFPNTHYHCIGNDTKKDELLALVDHLGLTGRGTIHGILTHSDLVL